MTFKVFFLVFLTNFKGLEGYSVLLQSIPFVFSLATCNFECSTLDFRHSTASDWQPEVTTHLYGFGCSTFPRRILLAMAATSLEFSSDVCSVVDEELPAQRLNEPKCQIDWNQRQRYIHVIAPIAGYFLRHTCR